MSNEEEASEITEEPAAEAAPATKLPTLLKIHGKEFDVSTSEGMIHAQAWGEAISSLVGRQANEVGTLRKFASERKPSKTEAELIAAAKQKAAEGDVEGAIEQMFGYAKETETKATERLRIERENNETWDSYFETRPELTKQFGKKMVRKVSESVLDLFQQDQDAFQALDDFWKPKVTVAPVAPVAEEKPKSRDVPPATLSGGTPRPVKRTEVEAPKATSTIDDILAGASLSAKVSKAKL